MELTIAEIGALVGIAGGLSVLWVRLTSIVKWRAETDQRLIRLEEGKDNIFLELKEIRKEIHDHIVQCAADKGETHAKLDALLARGKE